MSKTGDIVSVTDEYLLNALNEVIKRQFNVVKIYDTIMAMACSKEDNYFGIIYRVRVSGIKENGEETQLSLILKIPPSCSAETRDKLPIAKLFLREAFIYDVTLPALCALQENKGIRSDEKYKNIACFKTGIELHKEFLIMQDGCSENFVVPPRKTAFDNEHCLLILKQMAKFHALSFVKKEENFEEFMKFTKYSGGIDDFDENDYREVLDHLVKKCINTMKNEDLKKIIEKFIEKLYEKTVAYMKPKAVDGYAVLTHADCWTNNIMIKYEDQRPIECIFIDWQTMSYSSPIIDVSFFTLNCTDEDTRKKHLKNWIEFYYKNLSGHIEALGHDPEKLYPRNIFDDHIHRVFLFGLAMSFIMLPATVADADDAVNIDETSNAEGRENMADKFSSIEVANRIGSRLEGMIRTCQEMKLI